LWSTTARCSTCEVGPLFKQRARCGPATTGVIRGRCRRVTGGVFSSAVWRRGRPRYRRLWSICGDATARAVARRMPPPMPACQFSSATARVAAGGTAPGAPHVPQAESGLVYRTGRKLKRCRSTPALFRRRPESPGVNAAGRPVARENAHKRASSVWSRPAPRSSMSRGAHRPSLAGPRFSHDVVVRAVASRSAIPLPGGHAHSGARRPDQNRARHRNQIPRTASCDPNQADVQAEAHVTAARRRRLGRSSDPSFCPFPCAPLASGRIRDAPLINAQAPWQSCRLVSVEAGRASCRRPGGKCWTVYSFIPFAE